MFKAIVILPSLFLFGVANADIKLNENILKNCRTTSYGIMYGCEARQEAIEGIKQFEQRKDLKLKYKIDYNYSCNANRITNINIVSESDNLTLGNFKYLGGTIEGEANSRLVIKDLSPSSTGRAKYNSACKLNITKIEQDLAPSAIYTIKRDICSIKRLNETTVQSQILLYFSQSLLNNVGVLSLDLLEGKLNDLKKYLNIIKMRYPDVEVKGLIDDIIGNQFNPNIGSINNIIKNAPSWGKGSQRLIQNLNSLYNNMQSIQSSMDNKIHDHAKNIYENNEKIEIIKDMPSVSQLYSNLMFEYNTLNGLDTKGFTEAECFQ